MLVELKRQAYRDNASPLLDQADGLSIDKLSTGRQRVDCPIVTVFVEDGLRVGRLTSVGDGGGRRFGENPRTGSQSPERYWTAPSRDCRLLEVRNEVVDLLHTRLVVLLQHRIQFLLRCIRRSKRVRH